MNYLENDSDTAWIGDREFHVDDNGVSIPNGLKCCIVVLRVNQKILSGVTDYLTPATGGDMKQMIARFDSELRSISTILGSYHDWSPTRVDYCLNIDLRSIGLDVAESVLGKMAPVLPADYVILAKMGRIPRDYVVSEKCLDNDRSLYLTCGSVRFHIYCKGEQMKLLYPDKWREEMEWVLRIEVQCLRHKTYSMKQTMDGSDELFVDETSQKMVIYYWRKVVGMADWYSLAEAKRILHCSNKRRDRMASLEKVLVRVSKCHGISGARLKLKGYDLEEFDRGVRELDDMGINPVTIPTERGLKHLKNPVRVLLEYDQSC